MQEAYELIVGADLSEVIGINRSLPYPQYFVKAHHRSLRSFASRQEGAHDAKDEQCKACLLPSQGGAQVG